MICILMCGGTYKTFEEPRWLVKINGEPILEHTIKLLRELGVEEIYISSNLDCFDYLGLPILRHNNNYVVKGTSIKDINKNKTGYWVDAFVPLDIPALYLCGDVWYSKEALEKVVKAETNDILFFGTQPPFAPGYSKPYQEPLAFKVVNQKRFHECIAKCKYLQDHNLTKRKPISWELYRVIEGVDPNVNKFGPHFVAIHDFALDIDLASEVDSLEKAVNTYLKSLEK